MDEANQREGKEPEGEKPQKEAGNNSNSFPDVSNRNGRDTEEARRKDDLCLATKKDEGLRSICCWS
jgi:hypothetical protein